MRNCSVLVVGVVVALFAAPARVDGRHLRNGQHQTSLAADKSGHVKLDVGLQSFEKNVTKLLLAGPLSAGNLSALKGFDNVTRAELVNHTLVRLDQSFKTAMAPLKKAIGKGWMATPEDGKDAFVNTVKGEFDGVFVRMLPSFSSNAGLMLHALKEYPAKFLTLKHAEDSFFSGFNRTVYRIGKSLAGYVEMNTKMEAFMNPHLSLIEVV